MVLIIVTVILAAIALIIIRLCYRQFISKQKQKVIELVDIVDNSGLPDKICHITPEKDFEILK